MPDDETKTKISCDSDEDVLPKSIPGEKENDANVSGGSCSTNSRSGHVQMINPTPEGTSRYVSLFHQLHTILLKQYYDHRGHFFSVHNQQDYLPPQFLCPSIVHF